MLFSMAGKTAQESHKEFCFAEIQNSTYWDGKDMDEVGYWEARYIDVVNHDIIAKRF